MNHPDPYFGTLEDNGFELSKDGFNDDNGIRIDIYNWMYHIGSLYTITSTFQYVNEKSHSERHYLYVHEQEAEIEIYPKTFTQIKHLIKILTPKQ